jgi:hypothetical protein
VLIGGAELLWMRTAELGGLFPWVVLTIMAILGFWCAETSWRLITGRERHDGGLLSPFVLILFGLGCIAFSIGGYLTKGPTWFGWVRLMPLAFACFGLAAFRWQHRKLRSGAA